MTVGRRNIDGARAWLYECENNGKKENDRKRTKIEINKFSLSDRRNPINKAV